jgi:midasin (ATPase involved in ribosome maturation)
LCGDYKNLIEGKVKDEEKLIQNSILHEKLKEFAINEDNFKKLTLIAQRINAKLPVILMGETGIGKTYMIQFLSYIMDA